MQDTQEQPQNDVLNAVIQVTEHFANAIGSPDLDDDDFNFMYDMILLNLKYLKAKRTSK